jgi:zinc D-Ala-D-Ala carboxypeptidase
MLTQLTEHFSLQELILSQAAVRQKIDNRPTLAIVGNLRMLALVLEQVRSVAGVAITVSSGYRSVAVNAAIGGAKNSAHCLGLAADINAKGMAPLELANLIQESNIMFDQLIHEGGWVHLGLSHGNQRRQVLTANFAAKKTTYVSGLFPL